EAGTGTLQKMIVESGSFTLALDLNGLYGSSSLVARPVTLRFAVAPSSFFTILGFNNLLRGTVVGAAMACIQGSSACLPAALTAAVTQLVVEKLPWGEDFDLAVRDRKTGFVFFNIEGDLYDYDANAQLLSITGGRLLISKEFASALGQPSEAGSVVG